MGIQSNADTPWKKILETYFQDCLRFFLPALENAIDWSKLLTFLEKELDQITKDSKTGKRIKQFEEVSILPSIGINLVNENHSKRQYHF